MWLWLALLSGLSVALSEVLLKKYLMKEVSPFLLGGSFFTVSGVLLMSIVAFSGVPVLTAGFFAAVAVTGTLNIVAQLIKFRALKLGNLSLTIPLLSFTPVFLILTSYLILGELPTWLGALGIFCVAGGSLILYRSHAKESFSEIFGKLLKHPGSMLMLSVAIIFSISGNFDKLATVNSSPLFASAVISLAIGISMLLLGLLFDRKDISRKEVARYWPVLLVGGIIFAVVIVTQNWAFSLQIVPYVNAVKRTDALFSVLFGVVIFKEADLRWRLLGASVMLLGVALIAL